MYEWTIYGITVHRRTVQTVRPFSRAAVRRSHGARVATMCKLRLLSEPHVVKSHLAARLRDRRDRKEAHFPRATTLHSERVRVKRNTRARARAHTHTHRERGATNVGWRTHPLERKLAMRTWNNHGEAARARERETGRETGRVTDRDTERQRDRETETERQRGRAQTWNQSAGSSAASPGLYSAASITIAAVNPSGRAVRASECARQRESHTDTHKHTHARARARAERERERERESTWPLLRSGLNL